MNLFCFVVYGVILIPKCSMPTWFITWKQQIELLWIVSIVPIAFRCNLPPLWCKIMSRLAPIISSSKIAAISLHTGRVMFSRIDFRGFVTCQLDINNLLMSYKFANSHAGTFRRMSSLDFRPSEVWSRYPYPSHP